MTQPLDLDTETTTVDGAAAFERRRQEHPSAAQEHFEAWGPDPSDRED